MVAECEHQKPLIYFDQMDFCALSNYFIALESNVYDVYGNWRIYG